MHPIYYDYEFGVTCIDTMYMQTGHAACYLMVHNDHVAFIDTGTGNTVPYLLATLAAKDIPVGAVEYVIPTHVHLDHAGGAGLLMSQLPNASLVIHPRGARHMIDPSKLIIGATSVYGAKNFNQLFGEVKPIDENRVIIAEDNSALVLADRILTFIDTPGHARHHFCVYDKTSEGFFTGDTFGLSYRELDNTDGAFILPTTTPVQFDPEAWQDSLTRLLNFKPKNMFLTHFGRVTEVERMASELRQDIDEYAKIAKTYAKSNNRKNKINAALKEYLQLRLRQRDSSADVAAQTHFLESDLELNTAGLEVWLDRLQKAAGFHN